MTSELNLEARPFPGDSEFDDESDEFDMEFFESEMDSAWIGEVSRSSADYIRWVQQSLNKVMSLRLAVDGRLGPQTRSAVRSFQQRAGLMVDGAVGPQTEAALIKAGASPSSGSLTPSGGGKVRCAPPAALTAAESTALAVTTNFETGTPYGCVVSKVDGISMGMIQWNLKAGTLQDMLKKFQQQGGNLQNFFGTETDAVRRLIAMPKESAVSLATSQGLAARWRELLLRLCSDPLYCGLQVQDIKQRMASARSAAKALGLRTVRGLSMMFDINVGDGLGKKKLARFQERIAARATERGRELSEREKLVEIADQAASYAGRWADERRARRMVIANGTGTYRRSNWNLDSLFPTLNNPSGI